MREFQRPEVSTVAPPFPSAMGRCLAAPCRFLPLQPSHERPRFHCRHRKVTYAPILMQS
jgi:hypothetical protein